ncbi:MAG: chloramphenicol acetyltransferase [Oscillospiraceae bacterium]|jgi:chloramphenicol O-acetyltransferase type A|nr:chloramphenicol acetyltransferase [Oscillospiraceae bacterium]
MTFTLIDMDAYLRKEHYKHYVSISGSCTYSVTTNIDITNLQNVLKTGDFRMFHSHCWLISKAVNDMPEFRMAHNEKGELGIFNYVNPRYNVFNKETETFGGIWTEYHADFKTFYKNCVADMDKYSDKVGFALMPDIPNIFDLSCLPWVNFTGFNLNIYCQCPFTWFAPQITIGKIVPDHNGRLQLPVSVQVNHAVCDGYHVGRFVERLQLLVNEPERWMS